MIPKIPATASCVKDTKSTKDTWGGGSTVVVDDDDAAAAEGNATFVKYAAKALLVYQDATSTSRGVQLCLCTHTVER